MESEYIELGCPHCGMQIDFMQELSGTAQSCPNCTGALVTPRKSGQPSIKIPLPIESGSVRLRRLRVDDWSALLSYWPPADEESICQWLNEQAQLSITAEGTTTYLGIETKQPLGLVGNFDMTFTDISNTQAMINVHPNPALMSDAIFRESCRLLFDFCFKHLNIHRLITSTKSINTELIERLSSVGLRQEATFIKDHFENGEWHDTAQFATLQEEHS